MSKEIQISASILCADFTKLGDQIKWCEDAGADMIHVDVMDGHFVPNITIGPLIIKAIRPLTKLPIEAHLMIEHPDRYVEDFADAGADIVSIHAECYGALRDGSGGWPREVDSINKEKVIADVQKIKNKGSKAFLVLNPGTPVCINDVLSDIDGVLMMSVNPGFAHQKFMPQILSKVSELREVFDGDIAIDGGINELSAPQAVKAGVNILATASYLFGSDNPKELIRNLKNLKNNE